jgi:spore maturation protein CgeB
MTKFSLVLFKSQTGPLTAKLESPDGSVIHIHSLVDPEAESRFFVDLSIWGDVLILEGTGLGYHLNDVLKKVNKKITIVVLEYYKQCADICADNVKNLCGISPFIITSQNNDGKLVFQKAIKNGELIQIIKHPASYRAQQHFYDTMLSCLNKNWTRNNTNFSTALMRGNFFLQQELNNAVVKNNDRYIGLNYEKLKNTIQYEKELQHLIQIEKPDLLISINMLGIDGNGVFSEYTYRNSIPVAIWFVDDPRPILLSQKQYVRKHMTAFCWEREYIDFLKKSGFSNVHYLPLATDPDLFLLKEHENHKIPLGFVGTSMAGTFRTSLRNKFLWKADYEPFVYEIAKRLIDSPALDISTVEKVFLNTTGIPVSFTDERNTVWLQSYILHTAGMLKRKNIIEALKIHSIELFGDTEGWSELIGKGYTLHPPVDYNAVLPDIYSSIAVNLNITSCQMVTAVNQRVFDVPVTGNFLITDYQKDLEELFSNNEVVVYHSTEELKELYSHYSKNYASRRSIVSKARERILKEHTYKERYLTMRHKMFN